MKTFRRIWPVLILFLLVLLLPSQNGKTSTAESPAPQQTEEIILLQEPLTAAEEHVQQEGTAQPKEAELPENGSYSTREDVSRYLILYGHLPGNFITKEEAEAAGWTGGSLEQILPGMCIGGDRFSNYGGLLPKAKGRVWKECDINTLGKKSRGAERLVFSNDGLIYYTDDHYDSFTLVYSP